MKKCAFTLVELLVVIIILGILASIAIPQMSGGIEKARGAEARKNLARIMDAEKLYFSGNNEFAAENWEAFLALDNPNDLAHRRFDYSYDSKGIALGLRWVEYRADPRTVSAKRKIYYGRLYENGDVEFRKEDL